MGGVGRQEGSNWVSHRGERKRRKKAKRLAEGRPIRRKVRPVSTSSSPERLERILQPFFDALVSPNSDKAVASSAFPLPSLDSPDQFRKDPHFGTFLDDVEYPWYFVFTVPTTEGLPDESVVGHDGCLNVLLWEGGAVISCPRNRLEEHLARKHALEARQQQRAKNR